MTRTRADVAPKARPAAAHDRRMQLAVLLCFISSGAAGLILEATLTRQLRLVLGNTTLAVTTVLCAYMGGLALGGYIGGRLSERMARPLRTYALLEGAIGVTCLLLPAAIDALQPLYRYLYVQVESSWLLLSLVRFTFCGLLLLVPTTFMGATLPMLSRWYAGRVDRPERAVARLYAANSLGAGGGVLLCAFALLPFLGVSATIRLACLVVLAICLIGLRLDSKAAPAPRPSRKVAEPRAAVPAPAVRPGRLQIALLITYGLSGAAALVYEVAWTRVLSLVIGSSVYAFSLMLAAFILGLALGSAVMGRLIGRVRDTLTWFAAVELGIGLTALAAVPLFEQLPLLIVGVIQRFSTSFVALQAVEFSLIVLVMIVPTTLMGAAFVLVSRACMAASGQVGRSVGGVYAANTVGAILGAFTATFVWIPWIGTQWTILLASAANVAIGVLFLLPVRPAIRPHHWLTAAAAVAALVLAAVKLPAWDAAVMTSGAYIYADSYGDFSQGRQNIRRRMQQTRLLFHREDICGTVTVTEDGTGERALAVGGKCDATRISDLPTQLLIAHVPLLMHPEPRDALVIGLASGISLGAAACHPLERIDCVEISPAIVQASRFFDDDSGRPLADPRVRLIVGDGRNHVFLTDRFYDVIISEPSNPWMAGIADLFTKEYFEACRTRLKPGGRMCVWVQAYQMEDWLFRSLVHTFQQVYPHTVIYEAVAAGDYLLIGGTDPIRMPHDDLARRIAQPRTAADLARIDIDEPLDLLQRVVLYEEVGEYAANGVLHTDDSAMLEYAAPRSVYVVQSAGVIVEELNQLRKVDASLLGLDATQPPPAWHAALTRRLQARRLAVESLPFWQWRQNDKAADLARQAVATEPAACDPLLREAAGTLRQANLHARHGELEPATRLAAKSVIMAPHFRDGWRQLAALFQRTGRWAEAVGSLQELTRLAPDDLAAAGDLAWLLAAAPDDKVRDSQRALELAQRLCRAADDPPALHLRTLAAAHAEAGQFDEAIRTAETALSRAQASGDTNLVAQLQAQLALYRQGQPYRLSAER